jgi:hypothetical protein
MGLCFGPSSLLPAIRYRTSSVYPRELPADSGSSRELTTVVAPARLLLTRAI